MHLLYLDESGKSGTTDYTQPWYVLGGLIVHDSVWLPLERELDARINALVPPPRVDAWELHMAQIFHGKSFFKGMPRPTRYALVDAVFDAIEAHSVPMIFIGIDKRAHNEKYARPDPVEALAYRFMLERYDAYLGRQTDKRGAVVSDEQKEIELSTRRAHSRYRRTGTEWRSIKHVIETPFFTPSHWSRMLQIIDVATYWVALHLRGAPSSPYWERIEPLLDCYPHHHGKGLKTFP